MLNTEAADLIEVIARSVKESPGQFQFVVHVSAVGTRVTSKGGTAMSVQATGGAPGSTTIGFQSSAHIDNATVSIANKAADDHIQERMRVLVEQLQALANELRKQPPDQNRLRGLWASLLSTWVPGVITSVVADLLVRVAPAALGAHYRVWPLLAQLAHLAQARVCQVPVPNGGVRQEGDVC